MLPLMRDLQAKGQLIGAPFECVQRNGPCEELYDTQTDPHEISDLISSVKREHRQAVQRLRAALVTWIVETADRGAIPEALGIIAPFEKEMHDWFGTPSWFQAVPPSGR